MLATVMNVVTIRDPVSCNVPLQDVPSSITINFSFFKIRRSANSSAVYLAIIASATESDHANTLGFKALETDLVYRQDDFLLHG